MLSNGMSERIIDELVDIYVKKHGIDIITSCIIEGWSVEQMIGYWFQKQGISRRGDGATLFVNKAKVALEKFTKEMEARNPEPPPTKVKV